jgi:hypothetical protein
MTRAAGSRVATLCLLVAGLGRPARATDPSIQSVAWLQGCWESATPQRTIDEQWSAPRGGTMLGTGRTVRGERTVDYEFVLLRVDAGHLAYEAHPAGQPSAVFTASAATADRVVFENPVHDYPQQVGYERRGADGLLGWIDGKEHGQAHRVEFSYQRVACAGSSR